MIRKRVVASGLVQGVFFRDACRRAAASHGVTGWVRNVPDGTVEATFEGAPEDVEQMVTWARHGPSKAMVRQLDVYEEQPEGLRTFDVTS